MPSYLVQTSYTTEALTALIRNPQNRADAVRKTVEKLGGSLTGLWLSFGDQDIVCIVEMPNNISAAALSLAVASGGSVRSTKTTPLLSVEEGLAAFKKAGGSGYKPVSATK